MAASNSGDDCDRVSPAAAATRRPRAEPGVALRNWPRLHQAVAAHDPPRILVAVGNHQVRPVLASSLRAAGYDVVELRALTDAADQFGEHNLSVASQHFDAIISDAPRSGEGGMATLARLRQAGRCVPIILTTSPIDQRPHQRGFCAGRVKTEDASRNISRILDKMRELSF
jgi:CheY-like chemotaxis protein